MMKVIRQISPKMLTANLFGVVCCAVPKINGSSGTPLAIAQKILRDKTSIIAEGPQKEFEHLRDNRTIPSLLKFLQKAEIHD